jgi:exonuclease III
VSALLDFILLSPDLADRTQACWRIWHPYDDIETKQNEPLKKALLTASDHFPVSVDLKFESA